MDQILDRDDPVLAERLLNELVVGQWDTLTIDLSITALVDELTNRLEVRLSVGDPWLDDTEHLEGGLGEADEDTVVDLEETKELEDLAGLWGDFVDTVYTSGQLPSRVSQKRERNKTNPLMRTTKTSLG